MSIRKKTIISKSSAETKRIARSLAAAITYKDCSRSVILALTGDLGSGKTTFLQGFAKGLGIKKKILSPTFVILKKFKLNKGTFNYFYHLDCYRIENSRDLTNINLKGIVTKPDNIVAIEWAEKVKEVLPIQTVFFYFKLRVDNKRELTIVDKEGVLF